MGLEIALKGRYDGILLDAQLVIKDDWKVLEELKRNPWTKGTPVMMLTSVRSNQNEATGLRLGVSHFIPKPWHPDGLALTVRVALREAEERARIERPPDVSPDDVFQEEAAPASESNNSAFGTAGKLVKLENVLNGGLAFESMTLIEGSPSTGKSVICQYLIYGAIANGEKVNYFSTNQTKADLVQQMASIDLDITTLLQDEQLQIHPIESASADDDPGEILAGLAVEIQGIPPGRGLIIVDHITTLSQISPDHSVLDFFVRCQGSCVDGKTVVVVARDSAFDPQLLSRLEGLCNNHINFYAEQVREKFVNTAEVQKLNNAELRKDNSFRFLIEPEIGVHIIPVSRVKF